MLTVRSKATDLVFQMYGRSLHPELFEICESRSVQRGEYQATIDITGSGHVITWRYHALTLTEVATSADCPLPQKRRLLAHRLKGNRCDRLECRGGVSYQCSFQLETVEPEVFWAFQEELIRDGEKQGLLYRFGSGNRLAAGGLSHVHAETRSRSLLVQAYHTFPDDFAVVKSQSLYQVP